MEYNVNCQVNTEKSILQNAECILLWSVHFSVDKSLPVMLPDSFSKNFHLKCSTHSWSVVHVPQWTYLSSQWHGKCMLWHIFYLAEYVSFENIEKE